MSEHQTAWLAWQQDAEQLVAGGNIDLVLVERLQREAGQFALGTAAIDHAALQRLSSRLAAALAWVDKVAASRAICFHSLEKKYACAGRPGSSN